MDTNKARIAIALVVVALGGVLAMAWFWKSNKSGSWDLTSVERPWQGTISIYSHIREHIEPGKKGLKDGGDRLPDEKDDGGIKWVAGGLDGAFGHHGGGDSEKSRVKMLHRKLKAVLGDGSPLKLKKLYEQLLHGGVLDFIDPLLESIVEKKDLDAERLEDLSVWIAKNAPDREPVKSAIALLGLVPGSDHSDLLLTLGRHEEFTLYTAVAISNTAGDDAEGMLFELAQNVYGWCRIHIVERLAKTKNPKIKKWMLIDGYKNSIMHEYLAYTCAITGGLRGELEKDNVDPSILSGAGDIIQALVIGGPAEDMDDYADGAVVVERYLHHLGNEPKEIEQLLAVDHIERFLNDEKADWKARESRGWTPELRKKLRAKVDAVKTLHHWKETILSDLASKDQWVFSQADQAAKSLGIDTWDHHYDRLESGIDDGWYFVMQTDDPARIDRVIALAEKNLLLDEMSSGPKEELGIGPEWAKHGHLDFVLQDLRRFPCKGWPLIRTGIRSPVIRNRHMALKALSTWGINKWPPEARKLLQKTLEEELDEDVRNEIKALLAGSDIN